MDNYRKNITSRRTKIVRINIKMKKVNGRTNYKAYRELQKPEVLRLRGQKQIIVKK